MPRYNFSLMNVNWIVWEYIKQQEAMQMYVNLYAMKLDIWCSRLPELREHNMQSCK